MNGAARRLCAVGVLLAMSGPAQALSCLRPDIASTYGAARNSQSAYSVLIGQLSFDASRLPPIVTAGPPPDHPIEITATFSGSYLSDGNLVSGYDAPVTLIVSCTGPWCGTITTGEELMIFAQHRGEGLTIAVDACPMWVFRQPTEAQLQTLLACHAGRC